MVSQSRFFQEQLGAGSPPPGLRVRREVGQALESIEYRAGLVETSLAQVQEDQVPERHGIIGMFPAHLVDELVRLLVIADHDPASSQREGREVRGQRRSWRPG